MNFISKLERKFGRHYIPNLMRYVIALYILGYLLNKFAPGFYAQYLMLDFDKVFHGQIWRLVTFMIQPPSTSFIFMLIAVYLYYMIGMALENAWGSFRFNLYFFSGVIFNIIGGLILYICIKLAGLDNYSVYSVSIDYINQSLFFAYTALYPNVQFLLFFIIPIKAKYLGWAYGAVLAINVISLIYQAITATSVDVRFTALGEGLAIIVSMANFLIFFLASRNLKAISPSQIKRRNAFKREVNNASYNRDNVVEFRGKQVITRHKCAVCGRTELDDENLEFRFCSKCDGNYEYCSDHLYTHEHVHKPVNTPPTVES